MTETVTRKVIILDSAKEEFKDIKKHVKKEFGDAVWNAVNSECKKVIQRIQSNPESGSHIDELKELGIASVKYVEVRQTKVVYEFDDSVALVHMFISTKRDFRSHLFKRFLNIAG